MTAYIFSRTNLISTAIFAVIYGGIMLLLGNTANEVLLSVAVAAPIYFILMGLWNAWRASRDGGG
ncbi:MAG: hypothetical protein JJU21_17460 [Salinarimonas sp.]|nr:hypothetical protein [Salinarimonas sp.]